MAPPTTLLSLLGAVALAGSASATCKRACIVDKCARAVQFATTGVDSSSRLDDCSSFFAVTVTPTASTVWVTEYGNPVTVTVTTDGVEETTAAQTTATEQTIAPSTAVLEKRLPPDTSSSTGAVSSSTASSQTDSSSTGSTQTDSTSTGSSQTDSTSTASVQATATGSPSPPPSTVTVPAYASACSDATQYSSACSCWSVTSFTVTASVAAVTSTTSFTSTITQEDIESPPLPSSSVSFPADDSWTATYTYSEYDLPVFTSAPDPSIEVDYPVQTTSCLMSATPTGDSFYLLSPGSGYVVKRGSALGPVETPATEAAAQALMASWNPPTFQFQVAQNAPDGLFDLVMHDGSNPARYVALDVQTGDISLMSSSTNGVKNHAGKCTTVFGVSCLGSLVVEFGSTSYVWTATNSSTLATPGTPPANNTETLNTMVLLPTRIQETLNQTTAVSKRSRSLPGRLLSKRDMSQYGRVPRCPNFQSKMVAVSNGVAPSPPNGCGPDGAWYTALVPNLSFGDCCNNHDTCYDTCSEWFEDCNDTFLTCMLNSCDSTLDHWYNEWLRPDCYAAAGLYYAAVSTGTAATHFQDGSKAECACDCADPDYAICDQGGTTCQKVRGLGANNSTACGGCGRNCGDKAHCLDGVCVCNPAPPTPDQCGNMCLDFMTHPRNCGGCGNVCASGYCYEGACFTPPANAQQCYPVDAITNGDFSSGMSGWAVSKYGDFSIGSGPSGSRSLSFSPNMISIATGGIYNSLPRSIFNQEFDISTTIRLCPGTQYTLDFQAYSSFASVLTVTVGGQTVLTTTFQQDLGVWLAQGPVTLPVFHTGDGGTSADGYFLDVGLVFTFGGPPFSTNVYQLAQIDVYAA